MQVSNQLPISQDRSFLMYSEVEKEFNISFLAVVRQEQLQNDTFSCKISAHWSCFQFIILSWEHKQGPTYPPARSFLSDHLFRASSALQLYPAPERYCTILPAVCISLICTSTMVLFSELFSPLSSARHCFAFFFFLIFFPPQKSASSANSSSISQNRDLTFCLSLSSTELDRWAPQFQSLQAQVWSADWKKWVFRLYITVYTVW